MSGTHESDASALTAEVRPVPDPTRLTTEQLNREIAALREVVLRAQLSLREIIETRLDAADQAIRLLQSSADKFPARIDEKIAALKEVHDQRFAEIVNTHGEKFNSIQTQFRERDVRTEQSSKDSKVAVDAALQAAKEAVGEQNKSSALAIAKSETSTVKQIDQLAVLIQNGTKALDDKIGDLKERLTRLEGTGIGERRSGDEGRSNLAVAVSGILLLVVLWRAFTGH